MSALNRYLAGILSLLILGGMVQALPLNILWTSDTPTDLSEGIAISDDGTVAVASDDNCIYFFDTTGNLLTQSCATTDMDDVSYYDGKFYAVNFDNEVYIFDTKGNPEGTFSISDDHDESIKAFDGGIVLGGSELALYDFNGNVKWTILVGEIDNSPSVYGDYIYAADINYDRLLVVYAPSGSVVSTINYTDSAHDTSICGHYLAVTTSSKLYLYDISSPASPKLLWSVGTFGGGYNVGELQVTFSPDCNYIAVADTRNYTLVIYDIQGYVENSLKFSQGVYGIDWKGSVLAISLENGTIIAYDTGIAATTTTTTSSGIPAPALLAFSLVPALRRVWRKSR
ncbi:hypothetical protein IPA_05265 [Ignicoccus pacificus DSM 13166]|uniref:Pyrrolo-quinoline quinone repeat domain-containing protein n=1 Tax=Ignicoccus pacificus DSM 13166 TaxID=940294 RepID=A0A977KBC8_9CREN|nr:hypothetical protein IPA_05265 [Ignicoccus pacificus DSM 13166]